MRANENTITLENLLLIISSLEEAIEKFDQHKIRELLIEAVAEFKPHGSIEDFLFSK